MADGLRFHTLDDLRALDQDALRALWELVPTERQRAYRAAYEREVRGAEALGSDALEAQVTAALIERYADGALVPLGTRWARTPSRVQEAARREGAMADGEVAAGPKAVPSPRVVLLLALVALLSAGVLLSRLGGGTADLPQVTPTPTPALSPTPTPLALEEQDQVIRGGDAGREVAYPVSLQVGDGVHPPRVWVVQRRRVEASEWRFDPNPDTASFVSGMAVRPVIGIPWSEDNAAAFAAMGGGTTFTVTLNTGAILTYHFEERREVRRSETGIFRQVGPGLVLLLIGETDAEGLPTATRTLVTASYDPLQELARSGELIGAALATLPTPTASPVPDGAALTGIAVEPIRVTAAEGMLTTELRLYNGGSETRRISPDDITLTLGYSADPIGPAVPAEGLQSFDLFPGQAADVVLVWRWEGEPFGRLGVGAWRFAVEFEN